MARLLHFTLPMKPFSTVGLAFCLLTFALAKPTEAEEHYIYRNAAGQVVISNKTPPIGTEILKKLDLTDGKVQQPQELSESQSTPKTPQ
jgi:hypothetical protein